VPRAADVRGGIEDELAATLLFAHGQTTERTVTAAERLGRALGVTVKVLPYWGELTVEIDGVPVSQIDPRQAARRSVAAGSAPTGALVACMFVSVLATPVVDRLHPPFAAVAFSAVVSLMLGFFLFNAATGLVELVSIGPSAPAALLTSIATSGNGITDHHGHDLRADPPAHAVRA
jgi:hypothetical protein